MNKELVQGANIYIVKQSQSQVWPGWSLLSLCFGRGSREVVMQSHYHLSVGLSWGGSAIIFRGSFPPLPWRCYQSVLPLGQLKVAAGENGSGHRYKMETGKPNFYLPSINSWAHVRSRCFSAKNLLNTTAFVHNWLQVQCCLWPYLRFKNSLEWFRESKKVYYLGFLVYYKGYNSERNK
jgi:hypothetical protein